MPNYYSGTNNYDAYKKGTGRKDTDLYFVVPEEILPQRDEETTYQWNFRNSRFVGSEEECKNNIKDYKNCKII